MVKILGKGEEKVGEIAFGLLCNTLTVVLVTVWWKGVGYFLDFFS